MLNIIKCEFTKLKRYSVLWVGVVAVLVFAAYAVYQIQTGIGKENEGMGFEVLSQVVIWNNFSLVFPSIIVLLGGFLINREYTDDTLKAVLTASVSFRKLLIGKLIVTGILTVLFAVFSFLCTFISAVWVLRFNDITPALIGTSFIQICGNALFNFLAVAPLIAWFSRKRNGFWAGVGIAFVYGICGTFATGRHLADFYPITAGLGIIGYGGTEGVGAFHPIIGCAVLALMVVLTVVIVFFAPTYDEVMAMPQKKSKKKHFIQSAK